MMMTYGLWNGDTKFIMLENMLLDRPKDNARAICNVPLVISFSVGVESLNLRFS